MQIVAEAAEHPLAAKLRKQLERRYAQAAAEYGEDDGGASDHPRHPLNRPNSGNTFVWKGRLCWCGAFDTRDGEVVAAVPYHLAYEEDFHHSFYLPPEIIDGMKAGEYQYFWVDDHGLQTAWREQAASPEMHDTILRQIELL